MPTLTLTLTSLPPEVLHTIFSYLSPSDLCTVAAVSNPIRAIAQSASLPPHNYLLFCAWRTARAVHITTSPLPTFTPQIQIPPSAVASLNATRYPVECVHAEKGGFITLGSRGGEVVRVHVLTSQKQFFVGPCSCPVTAVSVTARVVVAGFAHCVPGNGHTAGAVAWDRDTGCRLAAFGGGVPRSSSAFPTAAVRAVVAAGERVALVCGEVVRVYEIASWRCVVEVSFGKVARVEMDESKLSVVIQQVGGVHVSHVLDFAAALERWPSEVAQYAPDHAFL